MNLNEKKTVLAIFPQLPLPQFAGDRQKVNNLIKILSRNYDLNVVIIARSRHTEADEEFLRQYCKKYKIFYLTKVALTLRLFSAIFKGESLQVAFFYNKKIQRYITNESKHVDFLFCNLIRVAKYIHNSDKPKLIDIVDSLSMNYQRSLNNVKSFFWKSIYKYEFSKLDHYEKSIMQEFDTSFLVNYAEQQLWQNRVPNKPIVWLPQGIKEELFDYDKYDSTYTNSIMFIGKMDYQPNIDAVVWFLKNVWDNIKSNIDFYIVGVFPPIKLVKDYRNEPRVRFTGYMEDPYIIMKSCLAVISPMQTGGGIQNKILEAMAMSKINIATSLGAESIRFSESGKNIIVVDDPLEMANTIDAVFSNPKQFDTISRAGYELAKSTYTWLHFENELITQINNSLCKPSSSQAV